MNDNVDTLCEREWIVHFARVINFIELFDTKIRSNSTAQFRFKLLC